jgi:putative SOS response-associated peptidase YedK
MAQSQPKTKVESRFKAKVDKPDKFLQSDYIVGFEFKNIPIIVNTSPEIIQTDYHWGLVPSWGKDIDLRKNTLNARVETIEEKPSFKNVTNNRCLIIGSSYFEWHWNDEKGKSKDKYQIFSCEDELFAFAGIYSSWVNPANGEIYNSFSMITTQANKQMEYIHNHKKRMPVILHQKDESDWLNGSLGINDISFPKYDTSIFALQV